jgi:hypothetical protein
MLGLLPLTGVIAQYTVILLGIPFEGALVPVAIFWSLVVYVVIVVHGTTSQQGGEAAATTLRADEALLGSLAMLAFCAGVVYLISERLAEIGAQNRQALVLDFVKHNETVMREVDGNGKVNLVAHGGERDGSLMHYEISVTGTMKTIYAIVDVSTKGGKSQFTLRCTTPLYMGQRDPFNPCAQQ